ncbi:MAG TPA: GNAT family N-acetyltransferase [Candidatus Saccharimonadales bacterium]|nr:GNAT family N-acetyltransferase [Candidatus Saccharimonadales bacterium]
MPLPEGLAISLATPQDAADLQAFQSDTRLVAFARELGLPISLKAPGNPAAVAGFKERIARSSASLAEDGDMAFVVARSPLVQEYGGMAGALLVHRIDDDAVAFVEIDVHPPLRRQRIGSALLGFALRELHITGGDELSASAVVQDMAARWFWVHNGMQRTGASHDDPNTMLRGQYFFLEYAAPQAVVAAAVYARLAQP